MVAVRIAVFSTAIVIDGIVHCHTAGALLSQTADKQLSQSSCGWVFDPFRPVQNHIGSGAGNPAHCYVRFGPRRRPSRLAHSQLLLLFFFAHRRWRLGA